MDRLNIRFVQQPSGDARLVRDNNDQKSSVPEQLKRLARKVVDTHFPRVGEKILVLDQCSVAVDKNSGSFLVVLSHPFEEA